MVSQDEKLVEQLKEDYRQADLTEEERVILDYSAKLTVDPASVDEGDIEALREVGLSDEEILEVAAISSFFNYVNRMADGLGVEVDEGFRERIADVTDTPDPTKSHWASDT